MAISAVQTSHLLYVDVDFWPSTDLYDSIQAQLHALRSSDNDKNNINPNTSQLAIVIPAFQISRVCRKETDDCRNLNIERMPAETIDLLNLLKQHQITSFDPTNHLGHGSTLYVQWITSQLQQYTQTHDIENVYDGIEPLPCLHSDRYEPYVVIKYCDTLPPFQQQFTGYGKNKMTWVMQLRHLGYQFLQYYNDGGFLVHYPHLDSPVRQSWNDGPSQVLEKRSKPSKLRHDNNDINWMKYKRGRVDALYVQFRAWLQQQPTITHDKEYITPMCQDAYQNQNEQDDKLWVSSELLQKYKMKPF
mmetsp:Transcript_538/g.507  ORF Transcript_538/g.507 Transcript_538/m.507 type:complete len:303 (-) Transcript_538:59-967(-)